MDVDFFKPTGTVATRPNSLVFTGSMDWLPNEDAMQYFINDVMPLVRQTVPDLRLTIVGRSPYPSLVELAQRDKNITVTGRVDDVRPYIEEATAFIVPIRIGGGTRLKIYEAMAMEKPVISTTVGAEGLPVRDGKELMLAGSKGFCRGRRESAERFNSCYATRKKRRRARSSKFRLARCFCKHGPGLQIAINKNA